MRSLLSDVIVCVLIFVFRSFTGTTNGLAQSGHLIMEFGLTQGCNHFHRSDFEEAWKRYLPSTSEKAATSATSATHDRGNVAAVAAVAPSKEEDSGLDL